MIGPLQGGATGMDGLITGAVAVVLVVAVAIIRLDGIGHLRRAVAERRGRRDTNGKVAKMDQQLDRMEAKMDRQGDTLEDLQDDFREMEIHVNEGFRTVALLHYSDPRIDNDVLRQRLGIEDLDDDLFQGSQDIDPDHHLDEWDPRNT